MNNTEAIPSLIQFLDIVDPKKTLDRQSVGKEIAFLAMISAAQNMGSILTSAQLEGLNKILENNTETIIVELIQFFDSFGQKPKYIDKVAHFTSYWTVDFMINMYKDASIETRKAVDVLWPNFKELSGE